MNQQILRKLLGLLLLSYCAFQSYYVYMFDGEVVVQKSQMFNGVLYAIVAAVVVVGLAFVFDKKRIKHDDLKIRKAANKSWSYLVILAMYAGIITAVAEILI